jgi:ribose transport system permease protein
MSLLLRTPSAPAGDRDGRLRPPSAPWLRGHSVYIALVVLIAFDLAVTPGFRNPFAARSLLFEAAPLLLITLGQSLAIGTRGIDRSVGSVMALSSAMIGLTLGLGQGASMLAVIGTGLLTGWSTARWSRRWASIR